jgi:ABC-type lipoprotein export system ATPase subunit
LRLHEDQLSSSCYQNLFDGMEAKYEEEMARRELYYTRSTVFITIISIIYLLLPLVIAHWAHKNSKAFSRLYLNTQHMEAYSAVRINTPPLENTVHAAEISFLGISFWVKKKRNSPKSLLKTRTELAAAGVTDRPPPDTDLQILRGISGVFRAREVTAIMGPTGGGKSTLLRLLGGRMNVGTFHGIRAINGSVTSPGKYDQILRKQGFVAQFDSLFHELTVWQTMAYGAMLQMPSRLATLEKMVRAWRLVSELGLLEVSNTKVGGESNSAGGEVERSEGISGGQRRLLSIGLTLLGQPAVVFADEPTSGMHACYDIYPCCPCFSAWTEHHESLIFIIFF